MASKKGKAAKSRARKGGRGGQRGSASMGGMSLFLIGTIITFGGVILAKLCKLPAWLSPVGAALWLFGWYRNNAFLRSLGLLYIGTGLAAVMGLPDAAGKAIDKAKAEGVLGGLLGGAQGVSDTGGGGGGSRSQVNADVQTVLDTVTAAAGTVGAVRTAFA